MSRRKEITEERSRLGAVAKSIVEKAKAEKRELTASEDADFNDCIMVIEAINSELKTLPEDVVPIVKLDERLTLPRTTPESPKVCAEFIDTLKSELAGCIDRNRRAGIEIELETWEREREFAHAHLNAILSLSQVHSHRPANV